MTVRQTTRIPAQWPVPFFRKTGVPLVGCALAAIVQAIIGIRGTRPAWAS